MVEFHDTHAHLDFPEFAGDLPQVIARAEAAGISRILSVATTMASARRVLELADRYPGIYAIVGVHPNHAHEEADDIRPELAQMARHPKVVAIGETGLDWYRAKDKPAAGLEVLRDRQRAVFRQQLEVAAAAGLNCVIHQREAFAETLAILQEYRGRTCGVFHCFSGTPAEAAQVFDADSLVSFTGIATFKNGQNVRDTLASVPLGRFMLETDCPFLAPVPHRGKRCEPAHVADLAVVAAEVKGCSMEALSSATCTTARAFFHRLL